MATVKVRIPIAIDTKGRWIAHNWGDVSGKVGVENHDHLLELYDYDTIGPNERLHWIVAEIPIPEMGEDIEATVDKP